MNIIDRWFGWVDDIQLGKWTENVCENCGKTYRVRSKLKDPNVYKYCIGCFEKLLVGWEK